MIKFLLIIGILLIPKLTQGQPNTPCSNSVYNNVVTNSTGSILYMCGTGNTWVNITPSSGSVPAGAITLNLTSCPTGFVEETSLNGVTLVGTLAANGNVGTTGGNDNITPSGTNSSLTFTGNSVSSSLVSGGTPAGTNSVPTFTGSALSGHAHELPYQIPSTTTTRQIAVATFGTGTSRAATAVSANGTANTTSAAVALSQSVSAGTPSGTVTAPVFTGSALATHQHTTTATGTINTPTFSGNAFDNRSSFVRVIFCRKS